MRLGTRGKFGIAVVHTLRSEELLPFVHQGGRAEVRCVDEGTMPDSQKRPVAFRPLVDSRLWQLSKGTGKRIVFQSMICATMPLSDSVYLDATGTKSGREHWQINTILGTFHQLNSRRS